MSGRVVIVGAGLAGLSCARMLHLSGVEVKVLDASDAVGGRVRTDKVDGFLLDRGFQVLLEAYPECRQVLDYQALDLKSFFPGALIRFGCRFHRLADPWRRPLAAVSGAFSPIGGFADKLRVARLRRRVLATPLDELFARPEQTTRRALEAEGFSSSMIERFFRPFLGGIFLEPRLDTSSRMFEFVFKMFSAGTTSVPARGMQRIPEQLAATLPAGAVETGRRVARIGESRVRLEAGDSIDAAAVVVATDAAAAAELLPELPAPGWCSTTCLYYATPRAPVAQPILVLDGDGEGPVNNICVPNRVSPDYAPPGQELISVSVLGDALQGDELERAVREQLGGWFGGVADWRHLRTYDIPHALPAQAPPALATPERAVRLRQGLYVCGDHRDNASIHGAMVSGRRAAETILNDFQAEGLDPQRG